MSCPECGCKTTYPYYEDDDDSWTDLERCAYCHAIFDIDDSLDEDDFMEEE